MEFCFMWILNSKRRMGALKVPYLEDPFEALIKAVAHGALFTATG